MSKRIIYYNGSGIAVITPCDCGLTIEQIAKKDVPSGVKYRIVDETEMPTNTPVEVLTADFSVYDGVGE